ncbi:MAG: Mov34/MPN/PAD-1 family protein [Nitrososphaerota archaeon]
MRVRLLPLALAKIINHSLSQPKVEVAGLLIGREENGVVEVWDAATGEQVGTPGFVILNEEVMVKVVEFLQEHKIPLFIVGWYHSHPSLGLFLSPIDIKTQLTYQSLYPNAIALVIDPSRYEESKKVTNSLYKIFRVNQQGEPIELPVTLGAGTRKLLESTLIGLTTTALFQREIHDTAMSKPFKAISNVFRQSLGIEGGRKNE